MSAVSCTLNEGQRASSLGDGRIHLVGRFEREVDHDSQVLSRANQWKEMGVPLSSDIQVLAF